MVHSRNQFVAQIDRCEGVDVDARSPFKSGWHIDAPFQKHVPRHFINGIDGSVVPLFVAGNLAAHRRMACVNQIADAAQLLVGVFERAARLRLRINLDRRITMPDADACNGKVVLREDKVVLCGKVGTQLVKDIGIVAQHLDLHEHRIPPLIKPDKLFMEVVKRSAGGPQPVLENADVPDLPVVAQHVAHRLDGKPEILKMLLLAHLPRRTQLGFKLGAVDIMLVRDDDLVTAAEKSIHHVFPVELQLTSDFLLGPRCRSSACNSILRRCVRPLWDLPHTHRATRSPPSRADNCSSSSNNRS